MIPSVREVSGATTEKSARRPPGWIAPGPPPGRLTPEEREALGPQAGEDLCYLTGDFRILQRRDGHRFSTDDLVTAHAAIEAGLGCERSPRTIVDLGSGIGTVLLILAWRFPDAVCRGIEAQDVSAELAERSIRWNGVADRVRVTRGDLRDPGAREGLTGADLVTGTPPYLPVGTGPESKKAQCGPCRFEHRGGIEAYCFAARELMSEQGRFVVCAAGFQGDRVEAAAESANLRIVRARDIVPRWDKAPLLTVFTMAHRTAVHAARRTDPPMVIRGENGRFSAAFDLARHAMGIPVPHE